MLCCAVLCCVVRFAVDFGEYKLDFDHHSRTLRRMAHATDGPVLFNAQNDKEYGLWGASNTPIELYTSVIDAHNHNVMHLHLEDVRNDITIDSCNLTPLPAAATATADGSASASAAAPPTTTLSAAAAARAERESHMKSFSKTDASGRTLTYKVVVRNGRVEDVIHKLGKGLASAKFVEIRLPVRCTLSSPAPVNCKCMWFELTAISICWLWWW